MAPVLLWNDGMTEGHTSAFGQETSKVPSQHSNPKSMSSIRAFVMFCISKLIKLLKKTHAYFIVSGECLGRSDTELFLMFPQPMAVL